MSVAEDYQRLRAEFGTRSRTGHREALTWFQEQVVALQARCPHPATMRSCCGSDDVCTECHAKVARTP